MVFLHFFGFGDSLRLFELEQETGLLLKGFRQHWDADRLQGHVMALWMEKAEQITSWQAGLQRLPREQLLVVGLGSHGDWQRHWERLLRV
jgi:hypothetical protein